MDKPQTITICSSAAFYKHVNQLQDKLESMGFTVLVPETAQQMRQSGNYDVAAVKTWYQNPNDYVIKKHKMDTHFAEVKKGDLVLIVNDQKHGLPGYIGPNVLMEMTAAYLWDKPIYILNDVLPDAPLYEEVRGMGAHFLNGDVTKLKGE